MFKHRGEAEFRNNCDAKNTLRYKLVNEKQTEVKKILESFVGKKLLEK